MASEFKQSLLSADDPPPVRVFNRGGASLFLLLGDHAGHVVPERLGVLGLADEDLRRHIALDIGVAALGKALAGRLDAPFVEQVYSRLVVDCNRSKGTLDSIAAISDGTVVPGNVALRPAETDQRYAEIFDPYHLEIERTIDERASQGRSPILVSLHSFTPAMGGQHRAWDIGVLYDGGTTRFARTVLGALRHAGHWHIGDNEPYRMDDTDFTIPRHAYVAGLAYIELEIRQDRLATADDIAVMADHLVWALMAGVKA